MADQPADVRAVPCRVVRACVHVPVCVLFFHLTLFCTAQRGGSRYFFFFQCVFVCSCCGIRTQNHAVVFSTQPPRPCPTANQPFNPARNRTISIKIAKPQMNIGTFTNVCVNVAAALWLLLCFGWRNWLIFTIIEPVHPSSTTAAMGRVAAHARARGTKF